jgi:ADP-ribose pyrophosphatase YjhB (NUDIX family)
MTNLEFPNTKEKVEVILIKKALDGQNLVPVFERSAKNGDKWYVFPGGKYAEPGNETETVVEGALREVTEEIGIKLSADDLMAVFAETIRHPKTPETLTKFILAKCPDGQIPRNVEPAENGTLLFVRPDYASFLVADRAPQEVHDYLITIGQPLMRL